MDYIWNITGHCNLQCAYCWDIFKKEPDIDTSQSKAIIDKITEGECNMLLFTGGEPLVRKDIFELMDYADKKGAKYIKMCTNGTLIHRNLEELVNSPLSEIHISLDSLTQEKEDYRGFESDKLIDNIELLIEHADLEKLKIVLVSVIDFKHLDNFEAILKYAREKKIKVSYQLPVDIKGKNLDLDIEDLTEDRIRVLFEQLKNFHKNYHDVMDYFSYFYYLAAKKYFMKGIIPDECSAGKGFQIISPKGEFYSCYSCKEHAADISECFKAKCLIWFRSSKKAHNILNIMKTGGETQ